MHVFEGGCGSQKVKRKLLLLSTSVKYYILVILAPGYYLKSANITNTHMSIVPVEPCVPYITSLSTTDSVHLTLSNV